MPDETGTETTRSDAPGVDDSLFGDAADTPDAVAGEQVSAEETEQGQRGPDAAGEPEQDPKGSDDAESEAGAGETDTPEELKVVVSIKEGRATIGVQQPSSDPHIESFDDNDLPGLTQEVPAVVERARAKWEESPKHPAYERPAPPAKRRNRRQQGTTQGAEAETEQTLKLF